MARAFVPMQCACPNPNTDAWGNVQVPESRCVNVRVSKMKAPLTSRALIVSRTQVALALLSCAQCLATYLPGGLAFQ